jgi:release factor glutamine methyltransferase
MVRRGMDGDVDGDGMDGDGMDGDGMDGDDSIDWRTLWAETERRVGDRVIARWICETASGADGQEFLELLEEPATHRTVVHLDAMVARYLGGEPLQYVLGHWAFRHLEVMVDPRVLIPRPETELLVDHAIAALRAHERPLRVADLGTGSGVIGLSLAMELWHDAMEVWLTDVSRDALDVARANAAGIGRAASAVRIAEGSWFEALPSSLRGNLHLVASNPPYIAVDDLLVEPTVHAHEPHLALYASDDGLAHLSSIAVEAPRWLVPGGVLLLEIGSGQGGAVATLLRDAGFDEVRVHADLAGHDRFVQGTRT